MQDTPDPDTLLTAVSRFLREQALPQLSGHTAFHARVAANVLDIVARQWRVRPIDDPAEIARLQRLPGVGDASETAPTQGETPLSDETALQRLNQRLCAEIAAGRLGLDSPELVDHLWRTTMSKLAVDQPRYETYRRLTAADDSVQAP